MTDGVVEEIAEQKRRGAISDFFVRLVKKKPLGTVGGVITIIFLVTAIFSNLLAPYGVNEVGVGPNLDPPSAKHLLGTDHLGRDQLSRIIFGARISVIISLLAASLSIFVSTIIGVLSGFIGGKFDLAVQRFVDAWMCFPGLIVLLVAVTIVGPGMWQIIFILGLLYGIAGSRIIRSAVIAINENLFVAAAHAVGCSSTRILCRHILPNIMAPLIVLFTTRVPGMILNEAGLSFLGLGIPPPAPSWGGMLSMDGRRFMMQGPWLAIWPGAALALVVYGVNMFGDAIRDLLDPRMRGGQGRY